MRARLVQCVCVVRVLLVALFTVCGSIFSFFFAARPAAPRSMRARARASESERERGLFTSFGPERARARARKMDLSLHLGSQQVQNDEGRAGLGSRLFALGAALEPSRAEPSGRSQKIYPANLTARLIVAPLPSISAFGQPAVQPASQPVHLSPLVAPLLCMLLCPSDRPRQAAA